MILKRIVCILTAFLVLFSLFSCESNISAYEFMREFCDEYPLSGVIYSSESSEHEDGYISEELFKEAYIFSGRLPLEFAVCLNTRTERGSECGIFKSQNAVEREELISMCHERIKLVSPKGTEGVVIVSGEFVFYSTLSEPERARELFYSMIK